MQTSSPVQPAGKGWNIVHGHPFGWSSRLAFVLLCLWNDLVQGRQPAAVTGVGELLSRRGNRAGRRHQCGFVTNLQIDALDDFQDFLDFRDREQRVDRLKCVHDTLDALRRRGGIFPSSVALARARRPYSRSRAFPTT